MGSKDVTKNRKKIITALFALLPVKIAQFIRFFRQVWRHSNWECIGCFTYLLTYLLTPWCRILLEKLTALQLVKKFPAFHGTRRFITALTSLRHPSLSWASPIQSIYSHPTSWRSILLLSTHLRLGLPSGLFPSGFQNGIGCFRFPFWWKMLQTMDWTIRLGLLSKPSR